MEMGKIIQISTAMTSGSSIVEGAYEITALDDVGNIWSKYLYPAGCVWRLVDMTTEFDGGE